MTPSHVHTPSYAASVVQQGRSGVVEQVATPPRLLTIAGSDSGGGAGIQADIKTFSALETYGMSVLTAVTAQNTIGVHSVQGLSPTIVAKQLELVVQDIGCDAIKTGMLYSADTIKAIVKVLEHAYETRHLSTTSTLPKPIAPPLVIDPVCVSTSGHSLLPVEALSSLKADLMPWATVITPNVPEAELLVGWEKGTIKTVDDMVKCAELLGNLGAQWVYLKGGHLPLRASAGDDKIVTDVLWDSVKRESIPSERRYLDVKNTHGTGCTLSAAIACFLAQGHAVPEAVAAAANYVATAIATSFPLGQGTGPVNHFHQTIKRSLPLPTALSPTPFTDFLIDYDPVSWQAYVNHPFPTGLAQGTIPLESFLHFIKQDYHFLKQYARTNALAVYKTLDLAEMQASSEIVQTVIKETESKKLTAFYCEKYGISREQLQLVPESVTNVAYTRYVLDVSSKGDLLDNKVVTAPCLIGYGQVGHTLLNASDDSVNKSSTNEYWSWIEEYGSDWFQQAVRTGIQSMEDTVKKSPLSQQRLLELAQVFQQATKLEIAFWDEAVAASQIKP
ncbi:trifunctional hydroxymethylpyrimidine kinase/phosphomethylpyrimidine kinase/thiaminase [Microbotryomycetes sp. JL201]|nr:trifunctional hydroxymethylpyrimidine kinase/phosphomethylpyrimidine kinase/thiaminase [Microbotryomycetes sp. JL201]